MRRGPPRLRPSPAPFFDALEPRVLAIACRLMERRLKSTDPILCSASGAPPKASPQRSPRSARAVRPGAAWCGRFAAAWVQRSLLVAWADSSLRREADLRSPYEASRSPDPFHRVQAHVSSGPLWASRPHGPRLTRSCDRADAGTVTVLSGRGRYAFVGAEVSTPRGERASTSTYPAAR